MCHLFKNIKYVSCRMLKEVVGSLVTHVCSGVGVEVDMALDLLCGLVTEKPKEMGPYAIFVKVRQTSFYLSLAKQKKTFT